MAEQASARSGDLELSVAASRPGVVRVVLANRGEGPLTVYFAADSADGRHHDFLVVQLSGEPGPRALRFSGDRDTSTTGLAVLERGEEIADELDVAAWARRPVNGATPLAPGVYELTATYRVEQPGVWCGALSAGPIALVVE